jgi:hypothetical protein
LHLFEDVIKRKDEKIKFLDERIETLELTNNSMMELLE